MQLSSESPRTRWLVMTAVWIVAASLLFIHAKSVRDYLTIVGQLGLRGKPVATTPLQQPYPAFAADAQTWVRHALSLLEGDQVRLRYTTIDNAPNGREVHWNSAWGWTIALTGWMDHWLTGKPLPQSMERITVWLPPAVLTLLMVLLSGWAARQGGSVVGVVVAIAMVGHPRIFEGFFPSYADHHGLLTVAVFGLVLGATFMGAGWWQSRTGALGLLPASREQAREGAVVSAISGACGLWVSAASVLPPIAIVGIAGFLALWFCGRDAQGRGLAFDGEIWRLWGRVGASASLVFYLVEYFPSHLGFRLESNHPFYALAWWGGAELIAQAGERWLGDRGRIWANWKQLLAPVAAVSLAPLTIAIGGPKVFLVIDPFLAQLHHQHIQEFLPLWKTIFGVGWSGFFSVVGAENLPLVAGVIFLFVKRRTVPPVVWFVVLATGLFTAVAWMQSRWLLNASGAQVCLTLVLLTCLLARQRVGLRWGVALMTAGLLFLPSAIIRITGGRQDIKARRVSPKDALAALWRDIATAIRLSQPTGGIVLAASPNSSTAIGYYGRFKTLGTLYWENAEGLKAAAALLAARSFDEAAALVRKHRVTHIAIVSEEHFIDSYYRLLHPGAPLDEIKRCFGLQLLVDGVVPSWLQMLPYKVPDDLSSLNVNVMLFKVAFEQTPAGALYHIALAKIARGQMEAGERDIDTLIEQSPQSFQPWLRRGEILFLREDWGGAAEATLNGIARAPASERRSLYANAASSFFRKRRHGEAIRIYRAALAKEFVPELASYLAFILATAPDEQLRDGREALALAERAVRSQPNSPTLLNSLAAALAENGRFDEAVAAASRALTNARLEGDAAAQSVSERRLESFKAKKPWRE